MQVCFVSDVRSALISPLDPVKITVAVISPPVQVIWPPERPREFLGHYPEPVMLSMGVFYFTLS